MVPMAGVEPALTQLSYIQTLSDLSAASHRRAALVGSKTPGFHKWGGCKIVFVMYS